MSHYELEEMSGENARNSTTLLMKSLKDILKESGADKYIDEGKTVPPQNVQAMPPAMAETAKTVPPKGPSVPLTTAAYIQPAAPRAELERPVCLGAPKKGILGRLFG